MRLYHCVYHIVHVRVAPNSNDWLYTQIELFNVILNNEAYIFDWWTCEKLSSDR